MNLSIITPVSRPENLWRVQESISMAAAAAPAVAVRWVLVFDRVEPLVLPRDPLIAMQCLVAASVTPAGERISLAGNLQRNVALDAVTEEGWVYFLDDDTVMHPALLHRLQSAQWCRRLHGAHPSFVVSQVDGQGERRMTAAPESMRPCHVDTGQVVLWRERIGARRWTPLNYCGDGEFIQAVYASNPVSFVFLDEELSIYNGRTMMTYQDESELQELVARFQQLEPRAHVLEIGSLHGDTLRQWIAHMEPGGTVVSVDMLVCDADGRLPAQRAGHATVWPGWARDRGLRFKCLEGASQDSRTKAEVYSWLPKIDFLFIDGGHDYETVLADWLNYSPLVRPGGMVAFHDIGRECPDVRRVWEQARVGKRSEELVRSEDRFGIGVLWV